MGGDMTDEDRLENARRNFHGKSDRERLEMLFRGAVRYCGQDIEDIVGELGEVERVKMAGSLVGFTLATIDIWHPRPDGRTWREVFYEMVGKR